MSKKNTRTNEPKIQFVFVYRRIAIVGAIVLLLTSAGVSAIDTKCEAINTIISILSNVFGILSTSVLISSLVWMTDISKIFATTVQETKDGILREINELKDSVDFATDIKKFPYDRLSDEQLTELSKEAIKQEISRKNDVNDDDLKTRVGLLQALEDYFVGIADDIKEGIVYRHNSRIIEIEPHSKEKKMIIRMKISQSLDVPVGSTGAAFSHKPVFKTREQAKSLVYKSLQINGENILFNDSSLNNQSNIIEWDGKFRRDWEYELFPGKNYVLELEHSFECYDSTYIHSAVLTYPCASFEVTCNIVGDEKELWLIDADAYCTKGHRLDRKHVNDILVQRPNGYSCIIKQRDHQKCLLDGASYKIVVYPAKGSFPEKKE